MTDKRTPSHARHYACGGKARSGICDQGGISEKKLADLIFKTTFAKGEEYTRKHIPSKQNDEEAEIRKAIRESEARRERWQMAYGDGNMPYEDFSKRMQAEMLMITEIEKKLSTIPKQVVSHLSSEAAVKMINDMKENWDLFEQRTKKDIMQSIFQRIVIRKDGDIWRIDEIVWA
jgi:site-specific DNA recombinase